MRYMVGFVVVLAITAFVVIMAQGQEVVADFSADYDSMIQEKQALIEKIDTVIPQIQQETQQKILNLQVQKSNLQAQINLLKELKESQGFVEKINEENIQDNQ